MAFIDKNKVKWSKVLPDEHFVGNAVNLIHCVQLRDDSPIHINRVTGIEIEIYLLPRETSSA
jgi:hypothetical protein